MASDESLKRDDSTTMYTAWIKSFLPQSSVSPETLAYDLKDGKTMCELVAKATGYVLNEKKGESECASSQVSLVLDFLQTKGIDSTVLSAKDVEEGDLKAMLDLLWLIILHFDVHAPSRAAYQRTISMGKRFLLEWIVKELPQILIDSKGPFLESFQSGVLLSQVLSKHCVLDKNTLNKEFLTADDLRTVLEVAERDLGVPACIIRPEVLLDGSLDEHTLLIYLAVLRRKISEKRGEESYKGGTPVKHRTPDKRVVRTPDKLTPDRPAVRSPYSMKSAPSNGDIVTPLSPKTLQNLVEEQAKSHEAIQALQEQLQAVKYQPLTPKFQKKPFQRRPVKTRSPIKASPQQNMKPNATDCNANLLNTGVDEALNLSTKQINQLYSAVDRRFLEFMLDAVHKSYVPAGFEPSESMVGGKADAATQRTGKDSGSNELDSSKSEPEGSSARPESAGAQSDYVTGTEVNEDLVKKESNPKVDEAKNEHQNDKSSNEDSESATSRENAVNEEHEEEHEESKMKTKSGQLAEFGERDSVISSLENTSNKSGGLLTPEATTTEDEKTTIARVDGLPVEDKSESYSSPPKAKSVHSLTDSCTAEGEKYSVDNKVDSQYEVSDNFIHDESLGPDDVCFDEDNDQFMLYLNSIETTALKFKLQVEQAKIETLQLLKERLELAYEGTPLEEIPHKVHEKLQETIAEIASEEVQKYEHFLKVGDELDEAESGIIDRMRVDLNEVVQENHRLHGELEDMKQYEKEYYVLREKISEMEIAMNSLKHDYATKRGESDFLSERIEMLEKEILNMRVEYESQIRELQNENIELQKECLELDNENRILEEEVKNYTDGTPRRAEVDIYGHPSDKLCLDDEVPVPALELDALEVRLTELERQNKALRSASSADQAMVQCLESKINDLENSLKQAQDNNSNLLSELHESQLQNSSDRAKLASYREENEAVRRENKVLKGTLEITEGEVKYHKEKIPHRSPKGSRREMWKEIRELENILKDVHREKRTIEKKYLVFKHESSRNLSSSSLKSDSSPEPSPPPAKGLVPPELSPGRSRTSSLLERVNTLLMKSSLPNGVKKDLEPASGIVEGNKESSDGNGRKAGMVSVETPKSASLPRNVLRSTSELSDLPSASSSPREKSSSLPRNVGSGIPTELDTLRRHVGSLEAEKASIIRELENMKTESPRAER